MKDEHYFIPTTTSNTTTTTTPIMFTKATCLTLFVLAVSLSGSDACVGSYPTKCCINGFCNVGPQGSTRPEASCPGGMCKSNPLCSDTPSGKRDYTSCSNTAAAPSSAPAAPSSAPAPAPLAPTASPAPVDSSPACPTWAVEGQCTSNPAYMLTACAVSCSSFSLAAAAAPIPSTTSCDQRNVDYSNRQNCCRCENQFARRLRGARKLGLLGNTISATTSVATDAGKATVAANSLYNDQLPCC